MHVIDRCRWAFPSGERRRDVRAAALAAWFRYGVVVEKDVAFGVFRHSFYAGEDTLAELGVFDFVRNDVAHEFGERIECLKWNIARISLGVALGVGTFQEPGGRPPVTLGGVS